jgi:hypothetical protein
LKTADESVVGEQAGLIDPGVVSVGLRGIESVWYQYLTISPEYWAFVTAKVSTGIRLVSFMADEFLGEEYRAKV